MHISNVTCWLYVLFSAWKSTMEAQIKLQSHDQAFLFSTDIIVPSPFWAKHLVVGLYRQPGPNVPVTTLPNSQGFVHLLGVCPPPHVWHLWGRAPRAWQASWLPDFQRATTRWLQILCFLYFHLIFSPFMCYVMYFTKKNILVAMVTHSQQP